MVNSTDINEINSLIIAQLAAEKNKNAIPVTKIDRNYKEETGERIPYAKLGYPKLVDYLKTVPGVEVIETYNAYYVNFVGTEDSQHIVDLVSKQRQRYPPRNPRRFTGHTRTSSNSYGPFTKTNKNIINSNRPIFLDDTFRAINFDTNYHSTSNEVRYSDSVSGDLDYDENIDLKINQKCVAGYQQNEAHESLEYLANSKNITDTTNLREYIFSQKKDYVSTALSKRVKFRLEKLIESHPQGIWCNELPKLYEEEYKSSLEWANLGFHRLSDFTAHLSDIFHVVGPQPNGDFKLYNAKEPLPDDKPSNKTSKKLIASSLCASAGLNRQSCPDDVITIQETVGQVLVTDLKTSNNADKNENPMVEVVVVEAYSPSFFWIRLLNNKSKFNKMMKSLEKYYAANYEKYAVPIIMLEQGLNITCVFYGKWHRAIIKSVDPDCKVTVLFYDYGTVVKFPANEIFYLHRSFTTLPAQAVPCGLFGIAPREGDEWPKRVRDWFIKWVCDRPLWANIVEVDTERNSMLVTLADTSGKDDFFVNDWLIDKKLAKVKKMARIRPRNFLYARYLQCRGMKKGLNVEVVHDENTRLTSNDHEPSSSESPLSRRINLLKKLRDNSNQIKSSGNTKIYDLCPTCGNRITKNVDQQLKTEDNLRNTQPEIKSEHPIISTYECHAEKSFDKVISWLQKHEMGNSELQQATIMEQLSERAKNISRFLTKDKNHSIQEKVTRDYLTTKNNNDKINDDRSDDHVSEKSSCNDHSVSSENSGFKSNLLITCQEESALIHDFQSSDNSNNASDSIAQWHGQVEPINWDEIKSTLDAELKERNHNPVTLLKNKPIFTETLLSSSREKISILEKMNSFFKNFIKAYYPLGTCEEDMLKLTSKHEIVKSDVITPMVIKILNIINKPYESIEVTIPDDIKEIIQNNSKNPVNNVSSKEDEDGEQEFAWTKETMSEILTRKDEVTVNENNDHNCEKVSSNVEYSNCLNHAIYKNKFLERLYQIELESNKLEEDSELDSDDFDNSSIASSGGRSQDEEKNTEGYGSFEEYNNDDNSNHADDEINTDVNRELMIVTPDHIPVFNDTETLTDDSEMDVCIGFDFLSQFYRQPFDSPKKGCTLKEINSENDDSDSNTDDDNDSNEELSEKS